MGQCCSCLNKKSYAKRETGTAYKQELISPLLDADLPDGMYSLILYNTTVLHCTV
jgi:hypothetical protein